MPQPSLYETGNPTPSLDPAFDDLTIAEQKEAWWRGSDDANAVRAGDDVEWAADDYFPSGMGRSRLKDEDWARVAYFLAAGVSVTELAKHFGVSRTTIWRGLQRSAGLRYRVLAEQRMLRRESDSRFAALRHAVVDGLQQAITAGNVRVLLWMAERLDLGSSILSVFDEPTPTARRPSPRPNPRPRKAPPAVQAILADAMADHGVTDQVKAGDTDAITDTPPPPASPSSTTSTTPADRPTPVAACSSDAATPPVVAPLARPLAHPLALRHAAIRDRLLRLRDCRRPRRPPLAEDVDPRDTEALLENSHRRGLPYILRGAVQPLDPYRPLRHFRWP